ncbi:MAG: XTP/dITP diphosphatase [Candidatus Izimaplasma sp.]|nr:XTP/dITP diphosphatase [Candidatus Izimaplasma bacterium]
MKEIVIATKNPHKVTEMTNLLESLEYDVKTLYDYPEIGPIEETGDTFKENALIKAKTLSEYTKTMCIADDSGIEVDALDGEPGVYSARFAGEKATYDDNNRLLLKKMKHKTNRKARFVTVICLYYPDQEPVFFESTLNGEIAKDFKGLNGFGYDPLFIVKGTNRHLAEYALQEKNEISHRAKALKKLIDYLKAK